MSVSRTKQKRNRILSWIINLAGVLAFALILYFGGVEAWQQILDGDWRYVLAALGVTLAWNLVATYRWSLIANQLFGHEVCAFRYYFTYQMIGMLIGQVVPITVGMLGGRPVALSLSQQVSLRRSALSVVLDKLFDLILALLLVTPVALYLVGWIERPVAFGIMAGVALGAVLLIAWQYERVLRLMGQVGARLARPLARVPVIGRRLAQRLPQQLERLGESAGEQPRHGAFGHEGAGAERFRFFFHTGIVAAYARVQTRDVNYPAGRRGVSGHGRYPVRVPRRPPG